MDHRAHRTPGRVAALLALTTLLFSGAAWGQQFNPEVLISSGSGAASEAPGVALDVINNAFVVWEEDGELFVVVGVDLSGGGIPITASGLDHLQPRIYVGSNAVATIVFERDPAPGVDSGEIFYFSNVGGPFGTPINLSQSIDPDSRPAIDGDPLSGDRNVVWARDDAPGSREVYFSPGLGSPILVAEGDEPAVASHSDGTVHLVYQRDGDIYQRIDSGSGLGAETLVSQDPTVDSDAAVVVDDTGVPHVVFVGGGDIQYARGDGNGGYLPLENLSASGADSSAPRIVADGNLVHVIYEEAGDIWVTSGANGTFASPENITGTGGVEEAPSITVDSLGFLHVVYRRAGDIYYLNNADVPVPSFEATPTTGELPLDVQFTSTSGGVITDWLWDFGDGTSSTQENPSHIYVETGVFDVTLTTFGPAGQASLTVLNLIQIISPSNVIRVPSVTVFQGQSNVYIPVLGTHPDPAQGYQLALTWDCQVIDLDQVTLDFTEAAVLAPEFYSPNIVDDGVDCYFTLGLVFDITPPFDGRTLAPGTDQRLLNLVFDIPFSTSPQDTVIDLQNGLSSPPILNIYTVDGSSIVPVIEDGVLAIVPFVIPPPMLFIRGDVDQSGNINLADGISLLAYLFQDGTSPPCLDAADVDDSGVIGIADAIRLLTFLFTGTGFPPYPYPSPGLDPTPDINGDC